MLNTYLNATSGWFWKFYFWVRTDLMLIGLFIDIQLLNLAHSYYPESTCKTCLHVVYKNKSTYPCKLLALMAFHLAQISGFLRRVPSPVQGTSHRIRSYLSTAVVPSKIYQLESFMGKFHWNFLRTFSQR